MRFISKQYQAQWDNYYKNVKPAWLKAHPCCQFEYEIDGERFSCASGFGVTPHHKMGRGKYIDDERYLMTVCPIHHAWIEAFKKEARKLGYILYK